jgi:hypothetical protein
VTAAEGARSGLPGPDWTVAAARDQVSTDLGGEVVILNLTDEQYYGLEGVGALLWEMIREPRTVATVRDAITDTFEVDGATAEADLLGLLAELEARGLVELHPPAAPTE